MFKYTYSEHELQDLEEFLKVHDLKLLKKLCEDAIKRKFKRIAQSLNYDMNEKQKKVAGKLIIKS